jgi:8-oxo-dGTP diphosphatase
MTGMNQRVRGILINDGKIALIQRVKESGTYYVFPGGGVEEGETISQALIREMKEELGIDVSVGDFFSKNEYDGDNERIVHDFYVCRQTGGEFGTGDGPEYQPENAHLMEGTHDPIWVPLSTLDELVLYPEVIKKMVIEKYNNE